MKPTKLATPTHTINALSDITGIDRRTLRKHLANTEPARTENGRRFYTVEQAMQTRQNTIFRNSSPSQYQQSAPASRTHWLYPVIKSCEMAGAYLHEAVNGATSALDYLDEVLKAPDSDPRKAQIEDEMNLESYGRQVRLHTLFFAHEDKPSLAEQVIDMCEAMIAVNQSVMEIDATLALTGFFSTPAGREMAQKVRAFHSRKVGKK